MALLATKAVELLGLRVPDDISIVGFDNMELVAHLEVPLTTVAQDGFAMGKRAAELLIDRIEGFDGAARKEILPISLTVRASASPA
jgi:DNA-binding LacI/PurR family transcriptional regulator